MIATESTGRPASAFRETSACLGDQGSSKLECIVVLLTVAAALVAAIQLAAKIHWFADLFTHFRVQYVVGASAVLLLSVLLRRLKCTAVLGVCVGLNVWPLLPYLPTAAEAAAADAGLSVLSANVRGSKGDPERLLELVAASEPDVVLVVEHTPGYEEALAALHGDYPYHVSAPAEGAFGIALYSRMPAVDAEVFRLGASNAVRATIEGEQGTVDFIGVHLVPPIAAEWALVRNAQIDGLASMLRGQSRQSVVCGDYNLSPYSPHFARLLDATGLEDPHAGRGLARTWPVDFPPLAIPIDHCLTGSEIDVLAVGTLGDIGSDHYPLLVEITSGVAQ